jgi:hypothetical protein
METEGFLPYSRKPATGPYPKPAESSSTQKPELLPVLFLTEHHAVKAYWGVEA